MNIQLAAVYVLYVSISSHQLNLSQLTPQNNICHSYKVSISDLIPVIIYLTKQLMKFNPQPSWSCISTPPNPCPSLTYNPYGWWMGYKWKTTWNSRLRGLCSEHRFSRWSSSAHRPKDAGCDGLWSFCSGSSWIRWRLTTRRLWFGCIMGIWIMCLKEGV